MKDVLTKVNYFTTAFLSILGLSVVSEVFLEQDMPDKMDDAALFLLGIIAIVWYKKAGFKANNKWTAGILVAIALVIKLVAIFVEHDDKDAVGDDIGIFIALIAATLFVFIQLFQLSKKKAK